MTDDAFDVSEFPQALELMKVVLPRNPELIVAGLRMFVPSVEFWNVRTTIRVVWPVHPQLSAAQPKLPTVIDQAGVDYGFGGGGGGGDTILWHGYLSTMRPVPLDVRTLTIEEDFGTYTIDFGR